MKSLLILILLSFCAQASASPWIAGSYGFRFEKDSAESNLVTRKPIGLLIGHRIKEFTGVLEYNTFAVETGNSTYSIKRRQNLYLASLRMHPFDNDEVFNWYPYFSGGVGMYRETIETTLLGMTDTRYSKWYPAGSLGIGVFGTVVSHFRAGAEFRILAAEDFDPQVLLDLSLRLGYEF